jgi:hypothetical protein
MIPLSQDEKLVYEDKKSGVKYFFKPLTGSNEQQYNLILSAYKKGAPNEEQVKLLDNIINFILIGWEGPGSKFPEDGNPSKCFNQKSKDELYLEYLKLSEIGTEEVKNS